MEEDKAEIFSQIGCERVMSSRKGLKKRFPHLSGSEIDFLLQNEAIGNMVAVPGTGIGTGRGHLCFGKRCICHELGEDKDSHERSREAMKILVVGAKGNMGAKYCAILRHLKEDVLEADLGDLWWEWNFDRVIIATPTDRHVQDIGSAMVKGKPILCEKPITKYAAALQVLIAMGNECDVDCRMVSNWRFAINRALLRVGEVAVLGEMEVEYNYYHSGNDGFFWDCIQLLMMAGRFKYDHTAPVFDCKVNGNPVTLDDISHSYPMMISEWLYGDKEKLWSLRDAVAGTERAEFASRAHTLPKGEIEFRHREPVGKAVMD